MLVSLYLPVTASAACEESIDLWNDAKYTLERETDLPIDRSGNPKSKDIVRQVEQVFKAPGSLPFGAVIEFAASKSDDGKPIKTRLFQHTFGLCRLLRDPVKSNHTGVRYYVEVQNPIEYVRSSKAKACGLIGGVA